MKKKNKMTRSRPPQDFITETFDFLFYGDVESEAFFKHVSDIAEKQGWKGCMQVLNESQGVCGTIQGESLNIFRYRICNGIWANKIEKSCFLYPTSATEIPDKFNAIWNHHQGKKNNDHNTDHEENEKKRKKENEKKDTKFNKRKRHVVFDKGEDDDDDISENKSECIEVSEDRSEDSDEYDSDDGFVVRDDEEEEGEIEEEEEPDNIKSRRGKRDNILVNPETSYENDVWEEDYSDIVKSGYYKIAIIPKVEGIFNQIGSSKISIEFKKKMMDVLEGYTQDIRITEIDISNEKCGCCGLLRMVQYKLEILKRKKVTYKINVGPDCMERLKALINIYNHLWNVSSTNTKFLCCEIENFENVKEGFERFVFLLKTAQEKLENVKRKYTN